MSAPLPSPKSRLRAVYDAPEDAPRRAEAVIYQLEDLGDPALRLRATLRVADLDGARRYVYRVEAFSRLSHAGLGQAERVAPEQSAEEFAAASRQFQSPSFRATLEELSRELVERYAAAETEAAPAG